MKIEIKAVEDFDCSKMLLCRITDGETNITKKVFELLKFGFNEYGNGWSEVFEGELATLIHELEGEKGIVYEGM